MRRLAALVIVAGAAGAAAAAAAATACSAGVETVQPAAAAADVRIAKMPPSAKDVIDAALASARVPLKNATHCASAGTEPADATIGRYLAGFLAELSAPDKKNWIETTVEPGRSTAGEPVSICTLMLRHQDGDDRWGWGVRFQVRSSDGLVLASSFSCVGAG
jgi:hypothetical protein